MQPVIPEVPDEMVLYLDFEEGLSDLPEKANFARPFEPPSLSVREIVDAIDAAGGDARVKGIFARMESGHFSLAHVHEIRGALKRFRETGKFAHIYSSNYGAMSGMGRYYLASVFDEIWMQPLGIVTIAGLNAEMPFARAALDKIGVRPQFFKRKDFKTAYESLTNAEMSPENRQMTEQLIADISASVAGHIAEDLEISEKDFQILVNQGLFTADEAVESGLIDTADYADVLVKRIKQEMTGDPESGDEIFVPAAHYAAFLKHQAAHKSSVIPGRAHKTEVALIHINGAIMPQDSGGRGGVAASEDIAPAILDAAESETIKAIVLRVDSPGGSPTASESILRAVERAQEKGKSVIVSMGGAAASGGYWVSAYADRIFALPTTLTGSIGVVGGKFVLQDLWTKIGVTWDGARWGDAAGMWSPNAPFEGRGLERVNAMLDQVYDNFIARVAKGRSMSEADVEKIAGGRVWTGARAVEIGLVDELGGLDSALDYTARALGLQDRTQLEVRIMPAPKTALEQLAELLGAQVRMADFATRIESWARPVLAYMDSRAPVQYEPLSVYEDLRIR